MFRSHVNIKFEKAVILLLAAVLVTTTLFIMPDSSVLASTTQTQTIIFEESTERNRSKTITIPGLISIKNVTVNTGNVTYTRNGDDITINVSGGTPSRTHTPTKVVTEKRGPQDSSSFPSSISYNDGEYRGTLYKDGPTYEDGIRIDTRTVTVSYGRQTGTSFPDTYNYNVGGYTGTLTKDGGYYQDGSWYEYRYVTRTIGPQASTSFPSTISVSEGGYSGSIPRSGSYYISGSDTKRDTRSYSGEWEVRETCTVLSQCCRSYSCAGGPSTRSYTDRDGYSGTLSKTSSGYYNSNYYDSSGRYYVVTHHIRYSGTLSKNITVYLYSQNYAGNISRVGGPMYNQNYTGTVSMPIQQYSQNYTGTVTAPTEYYYTYIVTIEYEANAITDSEVLHVDEFVNKLGVPAVPGIFYAGEAFNLKANTIGLVDEVIVTSPFDVGPKTIKLKQGDDADSWENILYHKDFNKIPEGSYTFEFKAIFTNGDIRTQDVTIQIKGRVNPVIQRTY